MTTSESKLSSVVLVGLLFVSALAVGGAGTATAGNSIDTSANVPLEDGNIYWQGQVLSNDTMADPGERLALYNQTTGERVRSVTADSSGTFAVNTTDLLDEYYLLNESGAKVASFQVVEQIIDFGYENYYRVDNGTATHVVDLSVDSNRAGGYALALESPTLNLSKRIESAQRINGTTYVSSADLPASINVSDLEDGEYRIDASVSDTLGEGNVTFRPANDTHAEFVRHPSTVELASGDVYWQGHSLAYNHEPSDEMLDVYTEEGVYAMQLAADKASWYIFDSSDLQGGYYLENDTHQLATFVVRNHRVNASFADATVTEGTGETTLSVTSNRSDYDLLLWAKNASRETLHEAVPASTVTGEGDLVVQNLSDDESLAFNYSALSAGNYTIYTVGNDTAAKSSVNLAVRANSSGGSGGGDDGGDGSGDDGDDGGDGSDDGDDGSTGGGGGGAGGAPPPAVRTDTVADGENYRRVKVTSARAGDPASVSLSGLGTERVSFSQLRIRPASESPEARFFVNASAVGSPAASPPTSGGQFTYLSVESTYIRNSELDAVTVEFRVPADATTPERVTVYRRVNGTWQELSTSLVGERDGDYLVRAEATGVSLFAVGYTESKDLGSETATATKTATSGPAELTATTTTAEVAEPAAESTAETPGQTSGPVGHGASSVLIPVVALLLALGYRTRGD